MRLITKIHLSVVDIVTVDIQYQMRRGFENALTALFYCLPFNYTLLSELIGSLVKAISSSGTELLLMCF